MATSRNERSGYMKEAIIVITCRRVLATKRVRNLRSISGVHI